MQLHKKKNLIKINTIFHVKKNAYLILPSNFSHFIWLFQFYYIKILIFFNNKI